MTRFGREPIFPFDRPCVMAQRTELKSNLGVLAAVAQGLDQARYLSLRR